MQLSYYFHRCVSLNSIIQAQLNISIVPILGEDHLSVVVGPLSESLSEDITCSQEHFHKLYVQG